MRKLVKDHFQPASASDSANRQSRSSRATVLRANQSHFIATRPIHAAQKPTAPTRPQIEPPPIIFPGICHPAQCECDEQTKARKPPPPAKTAAQATAPILMIFPQDRWSKYLFSVAGLSLNVIWSPVTMRC